MTTLRTRRRATAVIATIVAAIVAVIAAQAGDRPASPTSDTTEPSYAGGGPLDPPVGEWDGPATIEMTDATTTTRIARDANGVLTFTADVEPVAVFDTDGTVYYLDGTAGPYTRDQMTFTVEVIGLLGDITADTADTAELDQLDPVPALRIDRYLYDLNLDGNVWTFTADDVTVVAWLDADTVNLDDIARDAAKIDRPDDDGELWDGPYTIELHDTSDPAGAPFTLTRDAAGSVAVTAENTIVWVADADGTEHGDSWYSSIVDVQLLVNGDALRLIEADGTPTDLEHTSSDTWETTDGTARLVVRLDAAPIDVTAAAAELTAAAEWETISSTVEQFDFALRARAIYDTGSEDADHEYLEVRHLDDEAAAWPDLDVTYTDGDADGLADRSAVTITMDGIEGAVCLTSSGNLAEPGTITAGGC